MQQVSQVALKARDKAPCFEDRSVGETILKQLGDRRFVLMTGASKMMLMADGLHFDIPRMSTKDTNISRVTIRLRGDDTYTMSFTQWKPSQLDFKLIDVVSGLHAEQLRPVFEDRTGLYTSLR